jgi:orotate phosphoribosyltransferase
VNLLVWQRIELASGRISDLKIECDALTRRDWETAALLVRRLAPVYGCVIGVPHGGDALAAALEPACTGNPADPVLIVDDVWTTGDSLRQFQQTVAALIHPTPCGPLVGVVLFARGPMDAGIHALFTLNEALWPL